MKKRIPIYFLLFLFSTYCVSYSQTLESIKNADTIYIYFDHGDFQEIKKPITGSNNYFEEIRDYEIKFDEKNYIKLTEAKYLNFDRLELKKESDIKIAKKSFLRQNKDKIIDINFIKKHGLEKIFYIMSPLKIYLIDKKEIKRNKIVLKEVGLYKYSYSNIS